MLDASRMPLLGRLSCCLAVCQFCPAGAICFTQPTGQAAHQLIVGYNGQPAASGLWSPGGCGLLLDCHGRTCGSTRQASCQGGSGRTVRAAGPETQRFSPALSSVKKDKNTRLSLILGKSLVRGCIQFPAVVDISREKEYPRFKRIFLRASRARAMRDFTVPTSTPSNSDIST